MVIEIKAITNLWSSIQVMHLMHVFDSFHVGILILCSQVQVQTILQDIITSTCSSAETVIMLLVIIAKLPVDHPGILEEETQSGIDTKRHLLLVVETKIQTCQRTTDITSSSLELSICAQRYSGKECHQKILFHNQFFYVYF